MKIIDKILDVVFPPNTTCLVCGGELNHNKDIEICEDCLKLLPFITEPSCIVCGAPIKSMAKVCNYCQNHKPIYTRAIAPFVYKGEMVGLIHALKFGNAKYIAKSLACFMAECFKKHKLSADIIIPAPLSYERKKQRGYNQSQLLATEISKMLNIPIEIDCLKKTINTTPQERLTYKERQQNLQNAFSVINENKLKNKTILLVDDVYTTGATAINCTNALKKAGAKNVIVLCACHTVME